MSDAPTASPKSEVGGAPCARGGAICASVICARFFCCVAWLARPSRPPSASRPTTRRPPPPPPAPPRSPRAFLRVMAARRTPGGGLVWRGVRRRTAGVLTGRCCRARSARSADDELTAAIRDIVGANNEIGAKCESSARTHAPGVVFGAQTERSARHSAARGVGGQVWRRARREEGLVQEHRRDDSARQ